jgi:hypothetical protein
VEAIPRPATILLAPLLCAAALTGCGGDDEAASAQSAGAGGPDATRIVNARVYQDQSWTVPGETPASVGRVLASLEPTWVSSLIRYQAGQAPRPDEVSAWKKIRQKVRAKSPNATFDVELNAAEYRTADEIRRQLAEIRSELHNDGWFFDFYTPAYRLRPEVVDAAIEDAHQHGEWVGGNAFGLSAGPPIPPGSDFIAVQDFGFKTDLAAIRELAEKVPVVFHLGNAPELPKSDGCVFIERFSTEQRKSYVRERAEQQKANDFRFGYPVFFPECSRRIGAANPGLFTFNAPRDGNVLTTFEQLMRRYN